MKLSTVVAILSMAATGFSAAIAMPESEIEDVRT
jgi:hypothetical protein